MYFFTLLLDLQDGTYIQQMFSDSPIEALKAWCLLKHPIIDRDERSKLYQELNSENTPRVDLLEGFDSIWRYAALTSKATYVFHIVRTTPMH